DPYPPGPVVRDAATLPVGRRFSLFVSGTDAYRLDNRTHERSLLGQYLPDGRVLVGANVYNARNDGTLEWVGPPAFGSIPQADANLRAAADQAAAALAAHQQADLEAARADEPEVAYRREDVLAVVPRLGVPAAMITAG